MWHSSSARVDAGRLWLSLVVLAWGAQAIVGQALLLREATVLMSGSELAWGVVLFAWLLGVAVGALVGGRIAESAVVCSRAGAGLVAVLLTLSAAICVELYLFRGARAWLGVGPGELLPLPATILAAMLLISPASTLVGMAFPLACRIGPSEARSGRLSTAETSLGFNQVYALESAGSLMGGAAFSFWAVEHLAPIQAALLCGAAVAVASSGLVGSGQAGRGGPGLAAADKPT